MSKTVDLGEWDKRIAPKLQDMEYYGCAIARHARHIQSAASTLPMRPSWETLARDALNTAENELRVALAVVKAAQERYDNTPTDALQAAE